MDGRDSAPGAFTCCFPGEQQEASGQREEPGLKKWHANKVCGHSKQQLNPLYHNAYPHNLISNKSS